MSTAAECWRIRVKRKLNSAEVIDALTDLFILRGVPAYLRSDNGPEFIALAVRDWDCSCCSQDRLHRARVPMGERLLRKLQRSVQGRTAEREVFYSLKEAQIIIESWRTHYNTKRPHSALGYRPPAPEAIVTMKDTPIMH